MMKMNSSVWVLAMVFGLSFAPTTAGALVNVKEDLIVANPCGDPNSCLYTWTLGSRLGDIIHVAEKMYGPRDKTYTLLGVEFTSKNQPSNWYPGNRKDILIQLTRDCMNDEKRALYQLSHEVFHVLSPTAGKVSSSVLEEGLAVYFSLHYMKSIGQPVDQSYIVSQKYRSAYEAVMELYKHSSDASSRIAKLRLSHANFSEVSAETLRVFFPKVHPGIIQQLVQKF